MSPLHILIAPDKFKGTLTAHQAAQAIAEGFRKSVPPGLDLRFTLLPIADGGEGTMDTLASALGLEQITLQVTGPLGASHPVQATYAAGPDLAVIEMSLASGLALVPPGQRDPLRSTTRGTGELILHALRRHPRPTRLIIGLGGSATNDAGAGLAAALGFQFLDADSQPFDPIPLHLPRLSRIISPENFAFPEILIASDVTNPLLGPHGATRTYGPQKGASAADLDQLEAALAHFADVVAVTPGLTDQRDHPGAGAAGGTGYGLLSFLNASLKSGFDLVADTIKLEESIRRADLVLTGEGSLDQQSLQGKGPLGVARLARQFGKPVAALAGRCADLPELSAAFDSLHPIVNSHTPAEEALRHPAHHLAARATEAAAHWLPHLR